jgi:hypothetical protein
MLSDMQTDKQTPSRVLYGPFHTPRKQMCKPEGLDTHSPRTLVSLSRATLVSCVPSFPSFLSPCLAASFTSDIVLTQQHLAHLRAIQALNDPLFSKSFSLPTFPVFSSSHTRPPSSGNTMEAYDPTSTFEVIAMAPDVDPPDEAFQPSIETFRWTINRVAKGTPSTRTSNAIRGTIFNIKLTPPLEQVALIPRYALCVCYTWNTHDVQEIESTSRKLHRGTRRP